MTPRESCPRPTIAPARLAPPRRSVTWVSSNRLTGRRRSSAVAARELGLGDVPLMCTQELDVAGAMPLVIRLMALVNTTMSREQISHVYLRGAITLRRDLAQ